MAFEVDAEEPLELAFDVESAGVLLEVLSKVGGTEVSFELVFEVGGTRASLELAFGVGGVGGANFIGGSFGACVGTGCATSGAEGGLICGGAVRGIVSSALIGEA